MSYKEKLFHCEVAKVPREVEESPSLKTMKIQLDKVLCSWIQLCQWIPTGLLQPELFCDFLLIFHITLSTYYFTYQGWLEYLGHNPK